MSNIKPYQIEKADIVEDYDSLLSPQQFYPLLSKIFGSTSIKSETKEGFVQQFVIRKKYAIVVRNLTYLGYDKGNDDYRLEKKRIQIPTTINKNLVDNETRGLKTFYIGVYSYESEKNFLYVVFDSDSYLKNGKNSSKHISVFDLLSARRRGYFFKLDKNDNRIYILNQHNLYDFFMNDNSEVAEESEGEYQLLQYLKKFWDDIPIELQGDECYREMFDAAYAKTFETEWVGYYHEFLFEKHLDANPTNLVELYGDKKKNGIDLDLKVNISKNFYADLKSDNENFGVQGNKKETIERILDDNGHIWYIVAAFNEVVMDSVMHFETCKTFNELLIKNNETKSIKTSAKLKNNHDFKYKVSLKNYYVLDINAANREYLLDYQQGKNSNSSVRGLKIKISKKILDEFKIFEYKK